MRAGRFKKIEMERNGIALLPGTYGATSKDISDTNNVGEVEK